MRKSKFLRLCRINREEKKILLAGALSKYRCWEFNISDNHSKTFGLHFGSCSYKRLFGDFVYSLSFSIDKLFQTDFVITDSRVWDEHTDKAITWEEYNKLPKKRDGKPKFKFRTNNKEKWYYSSKFLKLYNLDFLNDPYGITFDFALFPFPAFISVQIGNHPRHNFGLIFDIDGYDNSCYFEICLFGYFVVFEIGKNTLIRKANLKYIQDFQRLVFIGQTKHIDELIDKQIERRNESYLKAIFDFYKTNDVKKLNKFLVHASYGDTFKKEVFDFLLEQTEYFNNWDEVKSSVESFEPYAVEKLKDLPTTTQTYLIGKDKNFSYYIMEDEDCLDDPHVHLSVALENLNWNGENFRNGQSIKTIAIIKLSKVHDFYTCDNLELETLDCKIRYFKQQICDWLNEKLKESDNTNSQMAIQSYILSNQDCVSGWQYKKNMQ